MDLNKKNIIENFVLSTGQETLNVEEFPFSTITRDFNYCRECSNDIKYSLLFEHDEHRFMTFRDAIIDLDKNIESKSPFIMQIDTPESYEVLIKGNSYFEDGYILLEILYYFDPINELGTRELFKIDAKLFNAYAETFINEKSLSMEVA